MMICEGLMRSLFQNAIFFSGDGRAYACMTNRQLPVACLCTGSKATLRRKRTVTPQKASFRYKPRNIGKAP